MPKKLRHVAPGVRQHVSSGTYYARVYINGREHHRKLGAKTKNRAIAEAAEVRAEILAGRDEKANSEGRALVAAETIKELSLWDIAERQLEGVSAAHLERIKMRWAVVIRTLPENTTAHETNNRPALLRYIQLRLSDGVKRQTIRRELRLIRRALIRAEREGYIVRVLHDADWPKLKSDDKSQKQSGKLWDLDSLEKWIEHLSPPARAEALLALTTGLRAAELKRLQWSHIRITPELPVAAIADLPGAITKSRRARVVGIPQRTLAALIEIRDPSRLTALHPGCHKRNRATAARNAGLATTPTLRDLRHTFATTALLRSQDARAVMSALGHSDLRMTERYLSSTIERVAALAGAFDDK